MNISDLDSAGSFLALKLVSNRDPGHSLLALPKSFPTCTPPANGEIPEVSQRELNFSPVFLERVVRR
jgi:hypothetical protein